MLKTDFFIPVYQAIGGSIVNGGFVTVFQLGKYFTSQFLTQFNAPLIKSVNIPDDTLNKNFMFIKSNKLPKGIWSN